MNRTAMFAIALALAPLGLAANDSIEIGVLCRGNVPMAVGVRMREKGEIMIPMLAVFRYCEQEALQGKPL